MAFTTSFSLTPITAPISVNTTTAGNQTASDQVTLAGGARVLAYSDSTNVYLRSFDAAGALSGTERIVNSNGGGVDQPGGTEPVTMAVLSNGNIVVAWADAQATRKVHYRIFDPALNPVTDTQDFVVTAGKSTTVPDVTALTGGGFAIVVQHDHTPADGDIYVRRYDNGGTQQGGNITVNGSGAHDRTPSIGGLTDGGFAVTHFRQEASQSMWRAVYNADGTVRASDNVFDATGAINRDGDVVALPNGGFLVSYIHNNAAGAQIDIRSVIFSANGTQGATLQASSTPTTNFGAKATVAPNGFVLVGFENFTGTGSDVRGSLIDPASGTVFALNSALDTGEGDQRNIAPSWIGPSHFAISETVGPTAAGNDGNANGVASRIIEMRRVITGDGANDTLTFNTDAIVNEIDGGGGADTIISGAANDILKGGDGDDIIDGGTGGDMMSGGGGNDFFVVDSTLDMVTESAGQGIDTVSTELATYTLGDNVENITGRNGAGQSLFGNALDNTFIAGSGPDIVYGYDGNDYIVGGTGTSILVGGAGNDQIYGGAGNDYIVGDIGDDVLVGFGGQDSLYGGAGNDYMVAGDGPGSVVDGGAGANTLWGAGGNDYIVGGEGADLAVGAAGSDYLFGNAGADTLYGGQGTDYIFGNAGNDFVWTDDVGSPQGTDYVYVGGGTGVDTVADFAAGSGSTHDILVVSPASGIGSFAQAQAAMTQSGVYTVLSMAGGDQVYLYNVQPFQLTAANFLFI